jgi:hypothetical protein
MSGVERGTGVDSEGLRYDSDCVCGILSVFAVNLCFSLQARLFSTPALNTPPAILPGHGSLRLP